MCAVERHQIVVIGGGPAGVSAALECFDIQLDVILLEAESRLGGQLAEVPNSIRNVAAGHFENGDALRRGLEQSAAILGDRVRLSQRVTSLSLADRRVETDRGQFAAEVLLLATGTSKPHLPGAADGAFGGDVTYQLESDLDRFVSRTVAVIGGGDSATLDALALAQAGSKVKLVHRSEKLTARRNIIDQVEGEPSIENLPGWELQSARGEERLEEIVLIHPATGEIRTHAVGGLVVKIGRTPSTGFLADELQLDRRGAILVDEQLRSSRADVFGAGDVVSGAYPRAATAMGARRPCGKVHPPFRRKRYENPLSPNRVGPEDGPSWVESVVAEFTGALTERGQDDAGALMALLRELHRGNLAQWELEDTSRNSSASDAAVARAKREIDALNAERHRLIEEVDVAIDKAMLQTSLAPPSTESPGMVLDRLSVLVIRIQQTELASRATTPSAARYAARLPDLHEELSVLQEALAVFLEEVREGSRRFVPYRSSKLYRS